MELALSGVMHGRVAIYSQKRRRYNSPLSRGGIAQLGERLHGMQEVSGSIPLTSTSQPRRWSRQYQAVTKSFSPHRLEA